MKHPMIMKQITVILILSFLFSTAAMAELPPYKVYSFDSPVTLVEWIAEVDLETVDSFNTASYSLKTFINDIKSDGEIIIPKYNDQYFPIGVKEGWSGITVWPEFDSKNWGCINYKMENDDAVLDVFIHRIDDDQLGFAKDNYKQYLCERYSYLGVGIKPDCEYRYMMVDRYDVLITAENLKSEVILKSITFEKVNLNNFSNITGMYSFEGYFASQNHYKIEDSDVFVYFDYGGAPVKKMLGDLDFDGYITAFDARKTLRASAELEMLNRQEKIIADSDFDGDLTSIDARNILRVSAELQSFYINT